MILNIHGKQYNLTNFDHPGGPDILKLCENEPDSTALFESYHAFANMKKIKYIMKKYEIGNSPNKSMFKFEEDGFYYTLKNKILKEKKYNRYTSKANSKWINSVLITLTLFILCQFIMINYDNSVFKALTSFIGGLTLMSLGFNILHDASHMAISKYWFINKVISCVIQGLFLWNHTLWSYHHIIRHHQYTGNTEYDPDTRNLAPFFRKSAKLKEKKSEFKGNLGTKLLIFNIIFPGAVLGQALLYHFVWSKKKMLWKMNLPKTFMNKWDVFQYCISITFIFTQLYYVGFLNFYIFIMAWNMSYYFCSAPDHDMYITHKEKESNKKLDEMDWGEMQVRHSGNFMNKYDIFTRFYGGINYQIEHHLFPSLNNHKLRDITPIVKQCCKDFNIPYNVIEEPLNVWNQICMSFNDVKQVKNY
jgi:acyl-lipid (8-3)-desaturase